MMSEKTEVFKNIPKNMRPLLQIIIDIMDKVCHEHLNDEYAVLARKVAASLARKRPSPLTIRSKNTWACGIVYALGSTNFLFDKNTTPYLSASDLCAIFGISQSTGAAKAKMVRDSLNMIPMEPKWCLPSMMDQNPLAWMIMVDGFIMDVRQASYETQKIAFEKGLIPYMPKK